MQYSFEEMFLIVLNEQTPNVFYLKDLIRTISQESVCDELEAEQIEIRVCKCVEEYSNSDDPECQLVQYLGKVGDELAVYRKIFIENEDGYFVKDKVTIPDFETYQEVIKHRDVVKASIVYLDGVINGYDQVYSKFSSVEDWVSSKLQLLNPTRRTKEIELDILNELIDYTKDVWREEASEDIALREFVLSMK